jgi:hypothetical protein
MSPHGNDKAALSAQLRRREVVTVPANRARCVARASGAAGPAGRN